jgi:hypothetical protein
MKTVFIVEAIRETERVTMMVLVTRCNIISFIVIVQTIMLHSRIPIALFY